MRLRYTGSDEARDLAVRGGVIVCPRGKWVDVEKEAEASGIPVEHALVVASEVAQQDDWESDSKSKAAPDKSAKDATEEKQ